jgi:hypothetical protein
MTCINSRRIWEENVAMIDRHNLEVRLGLHSYTLNVNQFGDMVNMYNIIDKIYFSFQCFY